MKRAIFSGILAVLFTAGMMAQAKPDFSGTWTLDPDKSVMGGGGGRPGGGGGGRQGGMGGGPLTITVAGQKMSISRTMGQSGNTQTTVYMLDGSASKNTTPGRQGGEPTEVTYTSKWNGAKLVTTITNPMRTSTETRWIDADGTMVVETTGPGREGTPMTSKLVYKKG
ncbi:MAG TPA: hypothetical protein VMN81_00410 [Vicinamibacterales bacterium]|nr:hypothetical protein [Vicinamibacterales bacterium]